MGSTDITDNPNGETSTSTTTWIPKPFPFSLNTFIIITVILRVAIGGSISIAGVASNIVNVIVFYRQGIRSNSSTVVLTALALSDLFMCLLSTIVACLTLVYLCFTDHFTAKWNLLTFSTLFFSRPMNLMVQFTCWSTTFLAFERAVSVIFPFKVKSIFTPNRCLAAIVVIFVLLFIIHIPNLFPMTAKWQVDRMIFTPTIFMYGTLHNIYYYASPITLRFLSVFLVITCNLIILWKVKMSQNFRSTNANVEHAADSERQVKTMESKKEKRPQKLSKEMKLLRMINMICWVFATCYTVTIPHVIVFGLVLKNNVDFNWMTEHVVNSVFIVFQLFNSSINIVIYYSMSSRYREELDTFWKKFCCRKP